MKNKKLYYFVKITVFAILQSLFINTAFAATFNDVSESNQNYEAIEFLYNKGIINGYDDGTFKPESTINRAEAMKIIMLGQATWKNEEFVTQRKIVPKETNSDETTSDSNINNENTNQQFTFNDIPENEWYAKYVYTAHYKSIIDGYDDETFRPTDNINYAESLKIILLGYTNQTDFPKPNKNPFININFNDWHAGYVNYAKEKMLIDPSDNGVFNLGNDISRGEFSEIIYRLLYMSENNLDRYDPSVKWDIFDRSILGYTVKLPENWVAFNVPIEGADPSGSDDMIKTILWKQDKLNNQDNYSRQFPNSVSAEIMITPSAQNKSSYFAKIRNAFNKNALITETTINGLPSLIVEGSKSTETILDTYLYLPDGRVAAIYGAYGNGQLAYQNLYHLELLRNSFEYTQTDIIDDSNKGDILTLARENIQKDGNGQMVLGLFANLEIIKTDTIGVGTGPVDYYYSERADITLKYERSFDVILDIETGKTTKF